jgi:hypothetical protein
MRRAVAGLLLATLALSSRLSAQTSTGEIDITVLDPTGAVIPNAQITITGAATGNLARTLTTSANGTATAPLLKPDTYDIVVVSQGFNQLLRQGIVLHAGDVLNLRLSLQLGGTTESVTVTGAAPLVEEKSGTLSHVVEEREIINLPLNGRNYLSLANLAPGAIPSRGSRDNSFSAYGNTGLQNAFLLDGARNENYLRGLDNRARDMLRPPLDALSEFNVQTSNYSAEFGASAGAVVNVITKSGTNQFHGSAYDFLRNSRLDAADYFALAGAKPLLVQNQWGGSIGGPLVRNRAWLFGAYEGTHIRNEQTSTSTVPTEEMRAGHFGSTPIFNPFSTQPNPNGSGFVRTQFANNTIPPSLIGPIAKALIDRFPLPNVPNRVVNNFVYRSPQLNSNHNATARGDIQVTSNDSMFVRLGMTRFTLAANPALPAPAQTPVNRTINSAGIGYGYTRTFGPTLVNEVRFSWTRLTLDQDATLPFDEIIKGSLDPKITTSIPTFQMTGFAGLGAQPGCCGNDPLTKSSGVWDVSDNVSKNLGRHLLKFGADFQIIRATTFAALGGRGSFAFNGVFTQDPQKRPGTGSALADLLLGVANTAGTGTVADAVERGTYAGEYFQDQWTITKNLTLNLGIRYELFFPYHEQNNKMANFILEPSDPSFGRLVFAGDPSRPRSLQYLDKNNWAPRVGFGYRFPKAGNLVVRGAFGIFYAQDQGIGVTNRLTSNPPFFGFGGVSIISDQTFPTTGFILNPGATIPRPSPVSPEQFVLDPKATTTLVSWDPRAITPHVTEWNLTVEKQLPGNMVWSANYVGNSGTHLWGNAEGNQPVTNGAGSPTNRRPLGQFTRASIKRLGPWNRSTYEGVSTRVQKQYSKGLSFLASLTYGTAMDLQNPALDVCDGCGAGNNIQNAYDRNANWAVADNNVPLRFVFSGVWDMPFGRGRRYLATGWQSVLAGPWTLTVIYQAQSGRPFTPVLSFDNANAGTTSRPDRVCSGNLDNRTLDRYFDTSCFQTPPPFRFGNSGRNILYGPGENNVDIGVHRVFPIRATDGTNRTNLEFRAEAFNLFNHPQFSNPNPIIGTAQAGVINSTAVANRQVQLGLRLSF